MISNCSNAIALIVLVVGFAIATDVNAEQPEATRSYLEASLGYYSATDGWNV